MKRSVDTGMTMEDLVKFEAMVRSEIDLSEIRKFYKTINVPKTITSFTSIAIERQWNDLFMWLLSEGFHSTVETSSTAFKREIKEGNLGGMKQIHRLTILPKATKDFVTTACFTGRLHIVKWLVANGFKVDLGIYMEMLDLKHYDVYQWLWENNLKDNDHGSEYYSLPALDGNIEFFEWAKRQGDNYQWESYYKNFIGEDAAQMGHLDLVQWAEANGCPLHWVTCRSAFQNEQYEVLMWLIERGYHKIEPTYDYDEDDEFTVELMMEELKKLGKM